MKHTSQLAIGRPGEVCPAPSPYDKWALLDALTQGAAQFELTHRTLSVLKALMTFLPTREIAPEPGAAIVFPANSTLSRRLNGMPESTLRRHLATLVRLGIVSRHDSPNRKRYARRAGGAVAMAFGFDLSPLAIHADQVRRAAQEAQEHADQLACLRDRALCLRARLLEQAGDAAAELLEEARRVLRRKPDGEALAALVERLQAQTSEPEPVPVSRAMSSSDARNERHIQDSIKPDIDSEAGGQGSAPDETGDEWQETAQGRESNKARIPTLRQIGSVCREFQAYFPQQLRSWGDLNRVADRLAPMLGIDPPVLSQARQAMGAVDASISVLCILERMGDIRSPGAYLRRLSQKAAIGAFSVAPMLDALQNRQNCRLTT